MTERFLRNVWGYHFANLILHIAAGLALFGVVRRTLLTDRLAPRFGPAATPLGFVTALIWIVHPLATDAVTYVCQRTEVLMGLFCFLTLYCSIRASSAGARTVWTAAAIAACALGMASKQTMIVVPLIVWLWDRTFARDGTPRRPLYAGLAATWAIVAALVIQERWPHSVGLDHEGWTPWRYLLTQTAVVVHYLRLVVVPWPLSVDYDGWPAAHGLLDVWPYALVLTALLCATAYGVVRRQPWSVAAASVFLLLAPSSSVLPLPTEIAAERRMYTPLAAIVVLIIPAIFVLLRSRRGATMIVAVVALAAAVPLAAMTEARNRDFWSDAGLWGDTVSKRPDNPRARTSYGVALLRERRYDEAEAQLREAVRLKATSAPAQGSLGTMLCMTGRVDEGIVHLERALVLDPEYTDAFRNLGEAYASQGRHAPAAANFGRAVDVAPDNPFLLSRLGWLLATSPEPAVRNGVKAIDVTERAVRLTSRQDVMALDTLGAAYAEARRFADAIATAREAAALAARHGDEPTARQIAGRITLYQSGRPVRDPPG